VAMTNPFLNARRPHLGPESVRSYTKGQVGLALPADGTRPEAHHQSNAAKTAPATTI